jgi:hypothetical protein
MPPKRTRRPTPAWNVSLAEFRGAFRACMRGQWWVFWIAPNLRNASRAEQRHGCFIFAAALVLPDSWHTAHQGRLSNRYYKARNDYLNLWRPLPRRVTTSVTTGGPA